MSDFENLLARLEAVSDEQTTMAKAMPADDDADQEVDDSTAAESDTDKDTDVDVDVDANPEDDDADEDEDTMTKSLTIDGEEVEVVDAEQLIKSLSELDGRFNQQGEVFAKALETTLTTIKGQGEMIKSLSAKVEKLSGQGRGRKTVLSVVEKPGPDGTLAKSEAATPTSGEIMAKALTAQKAGKITGLDVSRTEIALQNGQPVPSDLLAHLS